MSRSSPHIGTLGESPLHASLKRWYAEPGDEIEARVDDYVIDIVRGELLIEVQTRGFSSMKQKLTTLLEAGHRVRIVHPISVERWIVKIDEHAEILSRRRSPKHGAPSDIFTELVSFPALMSLEELEIDLVLVHEDEVRRHQPDGPWRRRGWATVERRLLEVRDTFLLSGLDDLAGLMPMGLPEVFTTAELADGLGRPRRTAQQMAYCLREVGVLTSVGKEGNAHVYRLAAHSHVDSRIKPSDA